MGDKFSNDHKSEHLLDNSVGARNMERLPLWDRVNKVFVYISDGLTKVFATTSDLADTETALQDQIDTINSTFVQVKKTIGVTGDTSVDYNLPDDANPNAFEIELVDIVPAFAQLVRVHLRCVETVDSTEDAISTIDFGLGTISGLDDLVTAADVFTAGDFLNWHDVDATISDAAQSLFITGITPDANWSTLTVGEWEVYVTYIK